MPALEIKSLNKTRGTDLELTELKGAFAFLDFYVKAHFDLEKHYMEVLDYPEIDQHKKAHEGFVQMIVSLKVEMKTTKDKTDWS